MSQSDIITQVQDAVRPGESCDIYYSNLQNSVKQAHPTIVENRYILSLNSKSFGSSATLLFNPDEGLDHIVLTLRLPPPSDLLGATANQSYYNGLALNAGWGYSCIRRIGVRYGNSSLYYFSGDQMLIDILSDCEDSVKKQEMLTLGGLALSCLPAGGNTAGNAGDFTSDIDRTAYVYLKLPHNTPSAQELSLPLPTDLLTAPIQVNVEFKNANEVFNVSPYVANTANAQTVPVLPTGFSLAEAQFKQIHFDDKGEQLARKVNMSEKAYSYPLKYFSQEVFRLPNVPAGAETQQTLTGLRSGNCLGIRLWVKENLPVTPDVSGQVFTQPNVYVTPDAVQLSVNGLIYFDSRNGQQQMWNLLERKSSSAFTTTAVTVSAPNALPQYTQNQFRSTWVWIPFGQHSETLANSSELTHGLSLMNSIVNLTIKTPTAPQGNSTYTVTAEYIFNSTLLFSRGGCEYIF